MEAGACLPDCDWAVALTWYWALQQDICGHHIVRVTLERLAFVLTRTLRADPRVRKGPADDREWEVGAVRPFNHGLPRGCFAGNSQGRR